MISDNTSMRTLVLAAYREVESRSDDAVSVNPTSAMRPTRRERLPLILHADSEDSEAWGDLIEQLV